MASRKGWRKERGAPAVYGGEWLRLSVHNIHGLFPNEFFLSCSALRLDCFKLQATTIEDAKHEALNIATAMCRRYRKDLAEARIAITPTATLEDL